ncbi:MAG: putative DNA binding domain-containing protein [Desulfobacteraceae bacterium]|nr:putative DNA binding domain-containing protein [Desulfobacteraceae bacterium]
MKPIQSIRDIEALAETIELECKLAVGADGKGRLPKDFWPTYSAFANTQGGVILLGVREKDRKFSLFGISEPRRVVRDLFNTMNNSQKVSISLLRDQDVTVIEIEGRKIIQIEVPTASRKQKPVYLNGNPFGNTYRRLHEGDRRCDDESVKRMLAEQVEDERDNRILSGFTLDDIDLESLEVYRRLLRGSKPGHPYLDLADREFLQQLKGWRRDRQSGEEGLTLAGLLMFGRWESIQDAVPHYFVDYQERPEAKAELRWVDRVIPDGTWSGNIFDFYRRVYRKLVSDLKIPFQLKAGQRQEDTPVHVALREALVNCLVHADFSGRVSVLVVKRPDMFGFRNPGNMRIPIEVAIRGGESDCRNRLIHQMFLMIGLGERAGSGLPKIYKGWESQHWRPPALYEKIEPEQTLLELRMLDLLPQAVIEELRARFGETFDRRSNLDRLILATAAIEQVVTHTRMTEMTADHPHDLSQALHTLVKDGLLESSGRGRGTVYHLKGESLPKPEQVFGGNGIFPVVVKPSPVDGDSSAHKTGSSDHFAESSTHNGRSSAHFSESSAHSGRRADGALNVQGLSNPLIDNLAQLTFEIRNELQVQASDARQKKHILHSVMEEYILTVCTGNYLTLQVLSELLNRKPGGLRQHYLKPLVEQGKLKLAFPTTPTHPQQAYITVQKDPQQG